LVYTFGVKINVILAISISSPSHFTEPRFWWNAPAAAYELEKLEPYGFIILMLLVFTGAVSYVIIPPVRFIETLLLYGLS
jgi:hypothetical protein